MNEIRDTFTKGKMIIFSSMTVGIGIGTILLGWVTYFATDYLGLSASTVGILFMISKLFDGFTDIVAGYVIDKTHSKLGKGRPYELAQIGYWVTVVFLFVVPVMNVNLTYAWIFVMYTLCNSVFLTLLNCSAPVYMANVIDRSEQTVTANSFIGVFSMLVSIAGGILIPQLAGTVGTSREGWSFIAIALAVPALGIGLMRFFLIKEKEGRQNTVDKFTAGDMLKTIVHNKYIILFSFIILVSNIGVNLINGVTNYYCTYILGDVKVASLMSLTMLASLISVLITPFMTKRVGFIKFMRILTALSIVTSIFRLVDPYSVPLMVVTGFFVNIGFLTIWLYLNTFVIDCMDYGEWHTGIRREGSVACVQSIFAKVGTALGTGMVGILMGMSGYNGALSVQPESANTVLIMLFSVGPCLFSLAQYIILRFYDLEKKLPQIHAELEARRQNRSTD